MNIATIKSQAEVVRNMVKRLRGLETTFTDSWGLRKTHFLLTYTPKEMPVAMEKYALGVRETAELLTEINKLLDIIRKTPSRAPALPPAAQVEYGRPATQQELNAKDPRIQWCQWCATKKCRLAGGDHLVVCSRFAEKKGARRK